MKALLLASFFATLPVLSLEAPRTDVIRNQAGEIVERWTWTYRRAEVQVTVRDPSGRLLRTFVLPLPPATPPVPRK